MLMSPPHAPDARENAKHRDDPPLLSPTVSTNSSALFKNKSTSNLPSEIRTQPPHHSINPPSIADTDTDTAITSDSDNDAKPSLMIEEQHAGEHGFLRLSGLRRIRLSHREPGSPTISPLPRSGSWSFSPVLSRVLSSANLPSTASSPIINPIEDLDRFPSESLHSFSFSHQSEEPIHNRQNVIKKSKDFMRDRIGWAASNHRIAAAQAKLSGEESMLNLLERANVIGENANVAHGLGANAPLTGPPDVNANVFEQSFVSPNIVQSPGSPLFEVISEPAETASISPQNSPITNEALWISLTQKIDSSMRVSSEISSLNSLSRAVTEEDSHDSQVLTNQPRSILKRTSTNIDDAFLEHKLTDAMAERYTLQTNDTKPMSPLEKYSSLPPINVPGPLGPPMNQSQSDVPYGHGARRTPVPQAIFTTESNSPWTITAANDLACLIFGVTNSEIRKLGILEMVREDRRKWLESRLGDPDAGSSQPRPRDPKNKSSSPATFTTLNIGSGITAKLISKPPSRFNNKEKKRRSQSDDSLGPTSASGLKAKTSMNHLHDKSRGVLLCGDVVPIKKRNGATGSATLWVKEKKSGLIWVLEEIVENVVYLKLDGAACILSARGSIEPIWGTDRIRSGMDVQKLIPGIPRIAGTNTGALDVKAIFDTRNYTATSSNGISIPIAIEREPESSNLRVSSFPHIAGIIILNSDTFKITSCNIVVTSALFGQANPKGLDIDEVLPGFVKLLDYMTDQDKIVFKDGLVIPEHTFRRARSLLAMRESKDEALAAFLRPAGLVGRHRDGADILVDVQMRVVKSGRPGYEEDAIDERDELVENTTMTFQDEVVVYALWITYSRHIHTSQHKEGVVANRPSEPLSPCPQASPGQSSGETILTPPELNESSSSSKSTPAVVSEESKTEEFQAPTVATRPILPSCPTSITQPPAAGTRKKTINDFVLVEEMGAGAYGQVKLCRYKISPGNRAVIKYVTKKRILVDTWTRDRQLGTVPLEIHVLDYLGRPEFRHPNIVEMADFFEDDVNYYIEMVPHGLPAMDLFDYIELRSNMDESEARRIFVQVTEAIHHLHMKALVVHRDIKDENVILDGEQNIKLIDFGSAAYIRNGPFDVFVGTIDYAAPEILGGHPYRGKEQDVWALGILLYTIIYKENPFYNIDEIIDHDLRVPFIMSDESIDLVRRMLNRDVDQRISIAEVLEHPWAKGRGNDSREIEVF